MRLNPFAHRPRCRAPVWLAALAGLSACSFQDFSSLQEDTTASGGTSSEDDATGGVGPGTGGAASGGSSVVPSTGGLGGMGGGSASLLANGSFETGNTMDWLVVPSSALTNRYVYVQAPTGTVRAPDGIYELAFWHGTDSYQVTISQDVDGLEDGTYTLTGYFSRGANLTATMFARSCSSEDPAPLDIPVTDSNSFTVFRITDIVVTGGTCEVGVTVDAGPGDWMNVDMLTLVRE